MGIGKQRWRHLLAVANVARMWRRLLLQILVVTLLANWLPAHAQLHAHDDGEVHAHSRSAHPPAAVTVDAVDDTALSTAETAICCQADASACCGGAHCGGLFPSTVTAAPPSPVVLRPAGDARMMTAMPERLDRPPRV